MEKQLRGKEIRDFGYVPDFSFDMNFNEVFGHIMPNIHNNPNIPQEVRDSWIELHVINNIDKLYESWY